MVGQKLDGASTKLVEYNITLEVLADLTSTLGFGLIARNAAALLQKNDL